jgi:hypothetical protein
VKLKQEIRAMKREPEQFSPPALKAAAPITVDVRPVGMWTTWGTTTTTSIRHYVQWRRGVPLPLAALAETKIDKMIDLFLS